MTKFLVISLMVVFIFFACEDRKQTNDQIQSKDTAIKTNEYLPVIELIRLEPQSPRTGDMIRAQVIVKGDTDGIIYQWSKNNLLIEEASNTLKSEIKRGDIISLSATPYKGMQKGETASVFTNVLNYLPVIKSDSGKSKFKGNVYYYQIDAVDMDGDKLTYSLSVAPQGMEIDPSSGLIKWSINPEKFNEPEKIHAIAVRVSDNYGGETEQMFDIIIGQP